MTGETENGKSIKVVSRLLPGNENLAIAQAAATPNTTLSGTAIAVAVSVRRIAANASESAMAATYTATPFLSPSTKTNASGAKRKTERNASATPIRILRTHRDSVVAKGNPTAG